MSWRGDQEGASGGSDPVIAFILTISEQLHACLMLPNSLLQPDIDAQESYRVIMEWIYTTIKSLLQYDDQRKRVIPADEPQNNPPAGIRRALQPSHPLVFQKATHELVGALSVAFTNAVWEADCD